MTLTRITRAEAWLAGGTHLAREKSAHTRGQAVGAFSRGLVLASEWHCPADAVAMRTAKTLAESYGMTSAAALTRVVGHVVLAVIATAEADRTKDAAIAFVDLIHAATGKRALMACSGREPIDAVEDYVIERVTTINVSFVICTVRAAAARNRLVGFTEPFMPAPNSTEYAVIMAPYVEAIKASGRTDAMVQPSTDAFREWLKPRLDDGSYFGWIARLDGTEVAGLGMMVIDWPPHPSHPLQSHAATLSTCSWNRARGAEAWRGR